MKPDEKALLIAVADRPAPKYRDNPLFGPCLVAPIEHVRHIGVRLGVHPKRTAYLCEKWASKGWYDYGCAADLGWLTDLGKAKAAELTRETGAKPVVGNATRLGNSGDAKASGSPTS